MHGDSNAFVMLRLVQIEHDREISFQILNEIFFASFFLYYLSKEFCEELMKEFICDIKMLEI